MFKRLLISTALGTAFAWSGTGLAQQTLQTHRTVPAEENPALPGKITDPDILKPPGKRNPASGAPAEWPDITKDTDIFAMSMVDRLEYGDAQEANTFLWDAEGWMGGDFNKFWWKTEGEGPIPGSAEESEFQALYARAISPFWHLQAGLRYDTNPNPNRGFAVFGAQGLAPYWFESDITLFVSERGKTKFRGEFEYEQLLSQRLFLMPRLEFNASANDDRRYGQAQGLNDTEIGLRLRYEILREFAPYIGVRWNQLYGETKNIAEGEGEDTSVTSLVLGLRAWF